jgi:DNA-binding ferritin-like protein (Dps family)
MKLQQNKTKKLNYSYHTYRRRYAEIQKIKWKYGHTVWGAVKIIMN